MTGHMLDLSRFHFERTKGDVTLLGTWVGETVEESEPALVLVPTYRMDKAAMKPCCVALSSAYKYDDPQYLLKAAITFNEALGFQDSMTSVHRIADLIYDNLQELLEMPPKPVEKQTVVADATVTDESGRQASAEIVENT